MSNHTGEKVQGGLTEEEKRTNVLRLAFRGDHERFDEFCRMIRQEIPEGTSVILRGSAVTASLLILALAAWFTAFQLNRVQFLRSDRSNLEHFIRLIESERGSAPIVIGTSDLFYKISYYIPVERRSRYVYLADTERSRKYLGHDTVDRSLLALNPWFGLHVERYAEYIAREHQFVLLSDLIPGWDWVQSALLDDKRQLRVIRLADETNRLAQGHVRFLFDVSTP